MRYAAAAAAVLFGGTALAVATSGEGVLSGMYMVGMPGLLVALFVVPLRSAQPHSRRRIAGWAAAVAGGGLLLLAAAVPEGALLLVILAALYLLIGWPWVACAACVTAAAAARSALLPGPEAARRTWARLSWTWLLGAVATYGYGAGHLNDGMLDVKEKVCRFDSSGGQVGASGGQSLLPLSDTSCGTDTVPGIVNPLLAVLVGLLAVCVTGYVKARRTALHR
ncbi:hypothetical protein GCM10010191_21650 [Actinomadura vinacea]|uniref:Uncharacterized protein n=1 Tax=Actinomadura vinacea TaxID=115336 RepID=A0ABN3ISZ6_9ACTN